MAWGFFFAAVLLAAAVVAFINTVRQPAHAVEPEDPSGWVYFVGGDDDSTPIKIGMTKYEPTSSRLHELKTMSPIPLKLFYKQWVSDRYAFEAQIHYELRDSRLHGEWFDRDVALYYAAHLRGEA